MKIVYVKWRDSAIYNVQDTAEFSEMKVSELESVGFLIGRDKDRIVIARDIMHEDCRGALSIPMENVVETKILKK